MSWEPAHDSSMPNVKKADSEPDAGVNETTSMLTATTGDLFRYDATSGQYIFNLSTKTGYTNPNGTTVTAFSQGTWTLTVILQDGTSRSVNIQLVK
jgi:VCBS repeat-containing protein